MDRFRDRFLSQVEVLQHQLEHLLEKDWGPERPTDEPFEVNTDLGGLETLGWSLPEREPHRSQLLFERLSPYFETGFCFHSVQGNSDSKALSNQSNQQNQTTQSNSSNEIRWSRWRFESAFHQGQVLSLLPEDRDKQISLPQMTLLEVRRLNPTFLLRELQLPEDLRSEDTSALVIRPSDQRLWILFSRLPDVFLKPHLTTIQEHCLRLLADFLDEE